MMLAVIDYDDLDMLPYTTRISGELNGISATTGRSSPSCYYLTIRLNGRVLHSTANLIRTMEPGETTSSCSWEYSWEPEPTAADIMRLRLCL